MRDSLDRLPTATCPYALSLEHESKGTVATYYYGCGDEVLSARVLNVTETFEVFVRVDLLDCAEVVVFSLDGSFLNRFTFNRQPFLDRKDIIAVSNDRTVVEEDYERIAKITRTIRGTSVCRPRCSRNPRVRRGVFPQFIF